MSDKDVNKELDEIREMLRQICHVLGIGAVPSASVISLKDKAKQRALEIKRGKKVN